MPNLPCDVTHFECWRSFVIHKYEGAQDKLDDKAR